MATATVTRRPLPTLKTRSLPAPPRQKSPEKSSPHVLKNEREINPIEKRLISIRLHLLHNTSRRTQPPSEPTLVFEPFLYLGGMKSLNNKVKPVNPITNQIIRCCFSDTIKSIENYSYSIRCIHSTESKFHSITHQTSFP